MKEEDKKKIVAPVFEMYEIKVEAMVPCTLIYKVLALDIEDAYKKIDKQSPNNIQHHIMRKKNIKAMVTRPGTLTILATKSFR